MAGKNKHQLSFCTINKLADDLVEVIADPDVEINLTMVEEYHAWMLANLKAPFMLLINKVNSYTYTFEAQQEIGNLPEIRAMAVVSYRAASTFATDVLVSLPTNQHWNLKIFNDRKSALDWLAAQRDA